MPTSQRAAFQVDGQRRADHSGGGGELGVQHHLAEEGSGRFEGRASVEAEPADPEDDHAKADQRHRVTRDRPRLAVGVVFALTWAEQQQRRQRPDSSGQMDDRGAGEVHHRLAADVGEQAPAPDRVRDQRVDHGAEDGGVDHVGAELDPLQGRAPDDRQRDRAEGEPVEHQHRVGTGHVERFFALTDRLIEVEEEAAGAEEIVAAPFGDPVADRPPGNRADRQVDEHLGYARPGVLLSGEADLEEHEPSLHQEDQGGRDGNPDHVQLAGLFFQRARDFGQGRCRGHGRQRQGGKRRQQHGEAHLLSHRTSS
jgi:hypothetical protein